MHRAQAPASIREPFPLASTRLARITWTLPDSGSVHHGFVRAANGTITTFKVAGAGTSFGQGTFPRDINTAGVIAGYYDDAGSVHHAFIRAKNHTITKFDVPGAGTKNGEGTEALHVNTAGTVARRIRRPTWWPYSTVSSAPQTAQSLHSTLPAGAGTGFDQGTIPLGSTPREPAAGIP